MVILGINDVGHHNSAASILIDGQLVASIEEERISRIKMDNAYPDQAIAEALAIAGIAPEQVDVIALAGLSRLDQKPFVDTLFKHIAKVARQEPDIKKFYWQQQASRITRLFKQRKKPKGILAEKPTQTVEHHLAHAASAYYASPFSDEKVGVITLDGVGDFSWGSVWLGAEGKLQQIEYLPYLNSIGLLYSAVTIYLGFKATRHEGKVLGLAAFGNPEPLLSRLLSHTNPTDWKELLDAKLARIALKFANEVGQSALRELCNDLCQEDVAAGIQAYTEQLICDWIQALAQKLQVRKLALAGGVFANVKLNQRLLALPEIDNIYIHPNMGDGGLATGAAYQVHARLHNGLIPKLQSHVYLGTEINRDNALAALEKAGLTYSEPDNLSHAVAQLLAAGKVVARATGKMEYGPRALGNRTVMAACQDKSINQWLNQKFQRTEFMPFAPVIIEEQAYAYFPDWQKDHVAARFMTLTYNASELAQKNIPAAIHVDNTARPQVIRREDNPDYYDIIHDYYQLTGVASVINTSFNMHEEPIVRTAEEAILAFQQAELDALVLGCFLIERTAN
jgi:carbamoyltransferase